MEGWLIPESGQRKEKISLDALTSISSKKELNPGGRMMQIKMNKNGGKRIIRLWKGLASRC